MKYIIVSGGVISGIGKGVIASSTGLLLKAIDQKVTAIKIDPYLNIDAGTMTPLDHGEVYVLEDGGEVDLDLGNYERFLDLKLTKDNNITTGKIYNSVIQKEGAYLGKTVQVVPHITNEIQEWIERVAHISVDESTQLPDICIVELGGTVGDIESAPFIEAMRQFQFKVGHDNFFLIHVSLIPVVGSVGEQKTKPTQASVRDLRGLGLSPDLIACRSSAPVHEEVKRKISMFCHVDPSAVLAVHDCKSVYHVPLLLKDQGLLDILIKKLKLQPTIGIDDSLLYQQWVEMAQKASRLHDTVRICLVGKYTSLHDSYISVVKSLEHAALHHSLILHLDWVESTDLEEESLLSDPIAYHSAWRILVSAQGILVPGGFGSRGHKGKIAAIKYARENSVPFLGICLGFQLAVIEYARNVLHLPTANSTEIDHLTTEAVIIAMPELSKTHLGGTMRLGSRVSILYDGFVRGLYGKEKVEERHRHRYEVNPEYIERIEGAGMRFVGRDLEGVRMSVFEVDVNRSRSFSPTNGHAGGSIGKSGKCGSKGFYCGTQFHPEFKTRVLQPSPIFCGFVGAAANLDWMGDYTHVDELAVGDVV